MALFTMLYIHRGKERGREVGEKRRKRRKTEKGEGDLELERTLDQWKSRKS